MRVRLGKRMRPSSEGPNLPELDKPALGVPEDVRGANEQHLSTPHVPEHRNQADIVLSRLLGRLTIKAFGEEAVLDLLHNHMRTSKACMTTTQSVLLARARLFVAQLEAAAAPQQCHTVVLCAGPPFEDTLVAERSEVRLPSIEIFNLL